MENKFSSKLIVSSVIIMICLFALKNSYVNNTVTKEMTSSHSFPVTHWIMMGLNEKQMEVIMVKIICSLIRSKIKRRNKMLTL